MRRLVSARTTVVALLLAYPLAAVAAPDQMRRAGLDVWNVGSDEERLRAAAAAEHDVDAQMRDAQRRHALGSSIAERLCSGPATRSEAEDAVLALAAGRPEWFALLRDRYVLWGDAPAGASDRDVAAAYLRQKLAALRDEVVRRGDAFGAAVVADRLTRFEAEGPAHAVVSRSAPVATITHRPHD